MSQYDGRRSQIKNSGTRDAAARRNHYQALERPGGTIYHHSDEPVTFGDLKHNKLGDGKPIITEAEFAELTGRHFSPGYIDDVLLSLYIGLRDSAEIPGLLEDPNAIDDPEWVRGEMRGMIQETPGFNSETQVTDDPGSIFSSPEREG
jgi:hypothetical protein